MLKITSKEDRLNYGGLLMPPEGFALEKAVGTTYSLDLEALIASLISMGLSVETDSTVAKNDYAIINALQKLGNKVLIFCESGQIKDLDSKKALFASLLDKNVIQVSLPYTNKSQKIAPSFHPKTWALKYSDKSGNNFYRYIVLSRNLTFDRSWDVAVCLEGKREERQPKSTKPLVLFYGFLNKFSGWQNPKFRSERKLFLKEFIDDLSHVRFSTKDSKFNDFEFLPLGIEGGYDFIKDELFDETFSFNDLLVISPFLSHSIINSFNNKRGLKDSERILITRRSELNKIKNCSSEFKVFAVNENIAEGERYYSEDEGEDSPYSRQDIHAKLYLLRKYSDTTLYVGSMNASNNGLERNVEMMLKLKTQRGYLSLKTLKEDLNLLEDGKNHTFEEIDLETQEATQSDDEELNKIEKEVKEICRSVRNAEVRKSGKQYKVILNFLSGPTFNNAFISPLRMHKMKAIEQQIVFPDLNIADLSDFYRVKIRGKNDTITRVVLIPTNYDIKERDDAIINSIIGDKQKFVEYLFFMLGEDPLLSIWDISKSKSKSYQAKIIETPFKLALYERLIKTAVLPEVKEKVHNINKLCSAIKKKEVIPEEFLELLKVYNNIIK